MALQDDSVAGSKPAEGSSVTDPLIAQPANQESDDILDVYGLPGFQHEFRIEIKAGASECFYQKLRKEMKLHVSFEVTVTVLVANPKALGSQSKIPPGRPAASDRAEHNFSVQLITICHTSSKLKVIFTAPGTCF